MPNFLDILSTLPRLGFGVGLKDTYFEPINAHVATTDASEQIEWLEIIPENYMNKGGHSAQVLRQLLDAEFPMTSHGVNLSLGSAHGLNPDYVAALESLFLTVKPAWFSDHLSFTAVNGHYLNDLIPLPFSHEAIECCVQNIRDIQARFDAPFLIENISYYAEFPHPDGLTEAQFLTRILEDADCGLLLDINNVYVNSRNHGQDPFAFLNAIPLERVVEIHIAGHLETDTLVIDTHGEPVRPEVFDLFSWLYPRCHNLKGVLLERDSNLPAFSELMDELQAVRMAAYRGLNTYRQNVTTLYSEERLVA